jgi:periplasmic protein TonB
MFRVLVSRNRSRIWTPTTVAVSAGAHLLLLAGVVTAAPAPQPDPAPVERVTWVEPPPPPPPQEIAPEAPPPPLAVEAAPEPRPSVPGETLEIRPPAEVPDGVAAPDLSLPPITDAHVSGRGRLGDHIGVPPVDARPPTGNPHPGGPPLDGDHYSIEAVEVHPALRNHAEVERLLQRGYPPLLREVGVEGRVLVEVVVGEDGRVRPGTARIVSASHDALGAATLRAVEGFRFRPARIGGAPVAVRVTIPIDWRVGG